MGARENKVETYLDEQVKASGGITRKWVSPGRAGVPDRIVIWKGYTFFIEVKTDDGEMSVRQLRECVQLGAAKADTGVVYGKVGVDRFVHHMLRVAGGPYRWERPACFGIPTGAEKARLLEAGFAV